MAGDEGGCCKSEGLGDHFLCLPPLFLRKEFIQRPMQHYICPCSPGCVNGYVLMEFNDQIFRREIHVPYVDRSIKHCCPDCKCGGEGTLKDRYAEAIQKACAAIARDVNAVARRMLSEATVQMDKDLADARRRGAPV